MNALRLDLVLDMSDQAVRVGPSFDMFHPPIAFGSVSPDTVWTRSKCTYKSFGNAVGQPKKLPVSFFVFRVLHTNSKSLWIKDSEAENNVCETGGVETARPDLITVALTHVRGLEVGDPTPCAVLVACRSGPLDAVALTRCGSA